MSQPSNLKRFSNCNLILCITLSSLVVSFSLPPIVQSQTPPKKVRLALPTKSVSFLAFYVAHHKGFYRDEGIDLEPILMQPALASTAVLTGDIDYNGAVTGVIGAAVATKLGLPYLSSAARIEPDPGAGTVRVRRISPTGFDVLEAPMPALIVGTQLLGEPRYPSLKGIMAARSKDVATKSAADLGLDAGAIGGDAARTKVTGQEKPPARGATQVVRGTPEEY